MLAKSALLNVNIVMLHSFMPKEYVAYVGQELRY